MNQKKSILTVLSKINKVLDLDNVNGISLMEGLPGKIIFQYLYNKVIAYKNNDEILRLTENLIEYVNSTEEKISLTYCDGLLGFLHFTDYIGRLEGVEYFELDDDIVEFLSSFMFKNLEKNEPDFLHGGLGVMHYYCEKIKKLGNTKLKKKMERDILHAIDILDSQAIKDSEGYRWDHPVYNDERFIGKPFFNMGIAHGLPGILSVLSGVYSSGIKSEKVHHMILETYKFIISKKNTESEGISLFQSYYVPHIHLEYDSRLAWCYGDLGISISLIKTAKAIKNVEILNEAITIGLHAAKRRLYDDTHLLDADFCHGSSGVPHMFGILFEHTKINEFRDAQEYWMMETVDFSKYDDGLAGFRTHIKDDDWGKDAGLLKGVAGIGLAMLSFITKDRSWDRFFLLD